MRASSIDHRVGLEAAEPSAILKPPWQRLLDRAIDLYLVIWLFIATGAILSVLVAGESGDFTDEDRGLLSLLRRGPVIFIAPLLIASRAKAVTALLLRNPGLLLLLLWIWCSVLWSVAPEISMRRALMLTLFTLLACYLVVRHDLDWILKKLAWLYLGLLLVSVLFILCLPSLSDMPGGRGLRVLFTHKNQMGYFLVMALILLPSAIRQRLVHPALGSVGLLVALVLLVPVDSATAIVSAFLVLATHAGIALWRLPARLAATATAFGVATACLLILPFVVNPDLIYDWLDRDATWTGRAELWQFVWQWIERRPLIGYGYDAFFENADTITFAITLFPWAPPNAHNGYLELLLGTGVVGLTLFMLFIGSGLVRTAIASKRLDRNVLLVVLPLLVGYISRAMTESSLLDYANIDWALVVIFTVSLTPKLSAIRSR